MVSLPFSDYCEPLCDSGEFTVLIRHLQSTRDREDWKYLEIRPVDGDFECEALAAGFRSRDRVFAPPGEPATFGGGPPAKFPQRFRPRRLRHAERRGSG